MVIDTNRPHAPADGIGDTTVVKVALDDLKTRIEAHKSDPDHVRFLRGRLLRLIKDSPNDVAVERAALGLLKHDWDVLNYEHPKTAQVSVGHTGIPEKLEVVIVNPDEIRKQRAEQTQQGKAA